MPIDYTEMRFWLDLAVAAGLSANFWWTVIDRRHRVTADQLEAHKAASALVQQEHRMMIQRLETRFEASPDDGDIEKLYNRMNTLDQRIGSLDTKFDGKFSGLSEGMDHIDKTVKTILDALINKGLNT